MRLRVTSVHALTADIAGNIAICRDVSFTAETRLCEYPRFRQMRRISICYSFIVAFLSLRGNFNEIGFIQQGFATFGEYKQFIQYGDRTMQKLFRAAAISTLFVGMSVAAKAADLPVAPEPAYKAPAIVAPVI